MVDWGEKDSPERSASLAIKLKIYVLYPDDVCDMEYVRDAENIKYKILNKLSHFLSQKGKLFKSVVRSVVRRMWKLREALSHV